jgi:hypothetical protein
MTVTFEKNSLPCWGKVGVEIAQKIKVQVLKGFRQQGKSHSYDCIHYKVV